MLGFEGAQPRQVQVVGLRRAQRRQFDPELVEVEGGDLLVEVLGQYVNLVLVLAEIGPQFGSNPLVQGQGREGVRQLTLKRKFSITGPEGEMASPRSASC
jgi:hypothetical protein